MWSLSAVHAQSAVTEDHVAMATEVHAVTVTAVHVAMVTEDHVAKASMVAREGISARELTPSQGLQLHRSL